MKESGFYLVLYHLVFMNMEVLEAIPPPTLTQATEKTFIKVRAAQRFACFHIYQASAGDDPLCRLGNEVFKSKRDTGTHA